MAQWKRAGPITQRSEDQNLALLVILSSIKRMSVEVYLSSFNSVFSTNQIIENDVTDDKRGRMHATKISIGFIWAYHTQITQIYSDLPFFPSSCHVDQFTFHILLPSLKFTIFIIYQTIYGLVNVLVSECEKLSF